MDEHAGFEARAVIAPRRGRLNRLAVVIPMLALAGVVWAGVSGSRSSQQATIPTHAIAAARSPSPTLDARRAPQYPNEVLGLTVKRLNEVDPYGHDPGEVLAIAGWYETTSITGCPPLPENDRPQPGAELNIAVDSYYCDRAGVLYARDPLDLRSQMYNLTGGATEIGLDSVEATVTTGIAIPLAIGHVGATAAPVVVLAHFVIRVSGICVVPIACPEKLVIDHLAWTTD